MEERTVQDRLRKSSKFFSFLLDIRAELFDEEFQSALSVGRKTPRGQEPIPTALLAMVTLLQSYTGLSDARAVDAAENDRRWQMVLGTLGQDKAPFGQGSLVRFRSRMLEYDLDQKLIDRTVALAKKAGGFGWQALKATLDSSPLLGAGRVEDTWNLLGRAITQLVDAICTVTGTAPLQLVEETGVTVVGVSSVKAALELDWDKPEERHKGLQVLVTQAEALRRWVDEHAAESKTEPKVEEALDVLAQVIKQDLEPIPDGEGMRIRRGVAKDRMPSLGDREMRHGRKSKKQPFNGYKRHIVRILGTGIIVGGVVRPANEPEHHATEPLLKVVEQHGTIKELAIDRGYLASPRVNEIRSNGAIIRCKPWVSKNRGRFSKDDFHIDLQAKTVTCPANMNVSLNQAGSKARFPSKVCNPCSQRDQCTTSKRGRSLSIHRHEEMLIELKQQKNSPEGRAALRERTDVEHGLARVMHIQGRRARYKGVRKNTLDLRRAISVANLQAVARLRQQPVAMTG